MGRALSASWALAVPACCFSCFFPFPVLESGALPWVYNVHQGRPLSSDSSLLPSSSSSNLVCDCPQPTATNTFNMSTPAPFVQVVEAPVTFKAYLMCAFASFGGIFFGYDSGYINGELERCLAVDWAAV